MANEITKVTDQNGVDHPFKDVAAFPRSEQAVLGAKNLIPFPYADTTKTSNTVTYTVNTDGKITANASGVTTGNSEFNVAWLTEDILPKGNYKISNSGTISSTCALYVNAYNGSTYVKQLASLTTAKEREFTVDYNGYDRLHVNVYVGTGYTPSNVVIYPMLRLASDPDDTYVLYAMTNKELTDAVTPVPLELTAGTNVDFNSNNKSCILGALKLIRTQIHITSALASGDLLLSANVKFVGFGSALLVNTNNGQIYGLLVTYGDDLLKIIAKGAIPEGYYAIDYCYV